MLRRLLITSNTLMISLSCLCAYCKGLHPLRERSYAGVLFPVLTCGATRSHPQHRATTGTYPSCQRWFLPVSAGTYPSGQRCCAASAAHSGRTKGGRDCVAEPIRLANAAAPLLLRSQARRKAYRARSAETKGTAQLVLRTQAGRKEEGPRGSTPPHPPFLRKSPTTPCLMTPPHPTSLPSA